MLARSLLLYLLCAMALSVNAQGTLRGTITDTKGQLVAAATVGVKGQANVGVMADFDGTYMMRMPSAEPTVMVVTAMGYATLEFTVTVAAGAVVVRDVVLEPQAKEIGGYTKTARRKTKGRDDVALDRMKVNSGVSFDYVSAERMTRTGDASVDAAVKRVPGVSTVGRFVSVRGLADRYIVTSVNGSRIPTLDPFTNNVSLDIFPTGLVDNIIITKTGSPELPGDWSGAFLSVNTLDYPSKLSVNITSSVGYNPQTTWKNIVSSKGSDTDWLGYDDGYRGIPDGVAVDQDDFPRYNANPSIYDQLSYLGLGSYLNSYGITSATTMNAGDPYHLLGLVELGYLAPALFNDPNAGATAVNNYNADYGSSYFVPLFNQELQANGQAFNNDAWGTTEKTAPLNFSQTISLGNQVNVFKRPLGFMVGFRYGRDTKYDENSTVSRTNSAPDGEVVADIFNYKQRVSSEQHGWSALANLSYKPHRNHGISFLFMPNVQGQNDARNYRGSEFNFAPTEILVGADQTYEERRQLIYQASTTHFFPRTKLRINLDASYTDGQMNILDFREIVYFLDTVSGVAQFSSNSSLPRRFRYMDEDLLDARAGFEFPLDSVYGRPRKLMFGGAYRWNQRENIQILYNVRGLAGSEVNVPLDELITDDRFIIDGANTPLVYENNSSELDEDIGISRISAAYVMSDYSINERLRLVGGARLEHTDLISDIRSYYDLGLPANDEGRDRIAGQVANPGVLDELDILPSINAIFKIKDDSLRLMNLRANYFRSLGRPSFREISSVDLDDFILRGRVRGNPTLQMTYVDNYDLRLETFFQRGHNITLSGFYKQFTNHIELVKLLGIDNFSWQNAKNSEAFGVELEGKLVLLRNVDLLGNITFIESRTTVEGAVTRTRTMFGQAPWIVNGMLNYRVDSAGFDVAISYNVQGPKLAVVAAAGVQQPDVYELPRHLLDITLSKKLGKRFIVRARVRDLLNQPVRRSYSFDSGYDLDFDRYTYGREYILSLTFRI
ncbi:MAG: outer membrane beta-barrel protein [Flavobacteriales bacterium]|nr:MAG: outer membrane beta-barrel protein [Flavobacteriales bacterium]